MPIEIRASQVGQFLSCQRAFYYNSILGLKDVKSKASDRGDKLHKLFADRAKRGEKPLKIIPSAYSYLSVENTVRIKFKNIILRGTVDLLAIDTRNNELVIIDYKTCNMDTFRRRVDLEGFIEYDSQLLTYVALTLGSVEALTEYKPGIRVAHCYVERGSGKGLLYREGKPDLQTRTLHYSRLHNIADYFDIGEQAFTKAMATKNSAICSKYGGCPFLKTCMLSPNQSAKPGF